MFLYHFCLTFKFLEFCALCALCACPKMCTAQKWVLTAQKPTLGSRDGQRAITLKYFENNKNFSKLPEISEKFEILGQVTS